MQVKCSLFRLPIPLLTFLMFFDVVWHLFCRSLVISVGISLGIRIQKILMVQHFGLIKGKLPTKASPTFMLLDTQCAMTFRVLQTSPL